MKKYYIIGMICGLALSGCEQKQQPQPPTMYETLGIDTTSVEYQKHKAFFDENVKFIKDNRAKQSKHLKEYSSQNWDKETLYKIMQEEDTLHMRYINALLSEHVCTPENDTLLVKEARILFEIEHLQVKYIRLYADPVKALSYDECMQRKDNEDAKLNAELENLRKEIRR